MTSPRLDSVELALIVVESGLYGEYIAFSTDLVLVLISLTRPRYIPGTSLSGTGSVVREEKIWPVAWAAVGRVCYPFLYHNSGTLLISSVGSYLIGLSSI